MFNMRPRSDRSAFFFFNDTATTEIYTLSLHDALPICPLHAPGRHLEEPAALVERLVVDHRSEEHTSELQSRSDLVCRLLLEKKKQPSSSRQPSLACRPYQTN